MQSLHHLKYIQKARLLHLLVPGEIPGYLAYLNECTETVLNKEEQGDHLTGEGISTDKRWIGMAKKIQQRMAAYAHQLYNDCNVFASQLFDEDTVIFCLHSIVQYVSLERYEDPRFGDVARYLFM